MSRRIISFLLLVCSITAYLLAQSDEEKIRSAKMFFSEFVALGDKYDPKVGNLYSDKAVIKTNRVYPDGSVKTITIPPSQWKQLVKDVMPLAKARGDRSTFSNVQFSVEGKNVRIKAVRYSELKKYSSPYSMLLAPDNSKWVIVEEITETKP